MRKPKTGVLGVFPYLDDTTEAIRRCRKEGIPVTVYSPTPRHEIEEALETTESPIRIFTLVGGFTGTASGAALAIWTSLDWPLITGGKEIVSLPAFTVIMFELTVLFGALATVIGLFINARLPQFFGEGRYHPSFSAGNFGVFAHIAPEKFDLARNIMTESGSEEVLVEHAQ